MNAFDPITEYTCEKGKLWRNCEGYHWTREDSLNTKIFEKIVWKLPLLREFNEAYYNNTATILDAGYTVLIGCKDKGSWEEVEFKQIKGTNGRIYTGKDNKGLALFIDKDGKTTDLIFVLSQIAIYGISRVYNLIPRELKHARWEAGKANWQGKPINEKQELKLKMTGSFGKDPFKDYNAAKFELDDIKIEIYILEELNDEDDEDEDDDYDEYAGHNFVARCDDKHVYYKI